MNISLINGFTRMLIEEKTARKTKSLHFRVKQGVISFVVLRSVTGLEGGNDIEITEKEFSTYQGAVDEWNEDEPDFLAP